MWENTYRTLMDYGVALREQYKSNLESNNRRATGDLLDSISVGVEVGEREWTVFLELATYWKYVENDTQPHFPPLDAIKEWIHAKPIKALPDGRGRVPTDDQLAFLIGRAMAGQSPNQSMCKNPNGGTTGTHDLENAQDKIFYEFEEKLAEAVLDDVAGDIGAFIELYFPKLPE